MDTKIAFQKCSRSHLLFLHLNRVDFFNDRIDLAENALVTRNTTLVARRKNVFVIIGELFSAHCANYVIRAWFGLLELNL